MTTVSRSDLANALRRIQRKFCAYDHHPHDVPQRDAPSICDCKFGATKIGQPTETGNGCPEMRVACWLVSCMTDAEFAALIARHYREHCGEGESSAPELMELDDIHREAAAREADRKPGDSTII
jgi:hypothetical protein